MKGVVIDEYDVGYDEFFFDWWFVVDGFEKEF